MDAAENIISGRSLSIPRACHCVTPIRKTPGHIRCVWMRLKFPKLHKIVLGLLGRMEGMTVGGMRIELPCQFIEALGIAARADRSVSNRVKSQHRLVEVLQIACIRLEVYGGTLKLKTIAENHLLNPGELESCTLLARPAHALQRPQIARII